MVRAIHFGGAGKGDGTLSEFDWALGRSPRVAPGGSLGFAPKSRWCVDGGPRLPSGNRYAVGSMAQTWVTELLQSSVGFHGHQAQGGAMGANLGFTP